MEVVTDRQHDRIVVRWRYVQVLLYALCNFICYADRTLISIAIVVMSEVSWTQYNKNTIK